MTRARAALAGCLLCWVWVPAAQAGIPRGQAVTYADFNYISAIATSQSHVYFATTNGVIVYNKIANKWEEPLTGADGLDNATIDAIRVGRFDDPICVKTAQGIFQYDAAFSHWYMISDWPTVQSDDHHVDNPKSLIAPYGINYAGNGNFLDLFGRAFKASDVVDDGAGNLWYGTWGYGILRGSPASSRVEVLPYGLLQNPAYTLHRNDTVLWIAGPVLNSYRTGLTEFDLKNNRFSHVETRANADLPDGDINCIETDSANVYLGTSRGLYIVSKQSHAVLSHLDLGSGLSSQDVISLKRVDTTLFLGTSSGLVAVGRNQDSITYIGQRQFFNRVIYAMDVVDSSLWIASNVGAYRYGLTTGRLQRFQDPSQVLFNRVFDVAHRGSQLWLASDAGVIRIDLETGHVEPFRMPSVKLDSRALAVNDQVVALASDHGLTLIYFDRKEPYEREFGTADGLASNYVYALTFDGDYLWVGTDKGVTRFWWNNPDRVN